MKKEETTSMHFGILGIFSLILAITAIFLSGYPGIIIAFVAVIAGIVGSRRWERLSVTGLVISGFVLIFLNVQGMGLIPVPAKNTALIRYYTNAIRSSQEVFKGVKKAAFATAQDKKEKIRKEILAAIDKGLTEARKVQATRFEPYIAGFSDHFRDEFVNGLQHLKVGFLSANPVEEKKGALLLDNWARWSRKNRPLLVKLWHEWHPQPSLFRTIFRK